MTAIALLVLAPSAARAQTIDPTRAEFIPSIDHYATNPDGTAVIQYYRLDLYLAGAAQPFQSFSLLKQDPDPDGIIRQDLTTVLVGFPIAGTIYDAEVAAVGPGVDASSDPSNTFSFSTTQCSATVAPTTQAIGADGGTASVSVTADNACPWGATSNVSWITVTAGSAGVGNGNVTYSVAANASATRIGTLIVAGHTVTVTQSDNSPLLPSLSISSASVEGGGSETTTLINGLGGAGDWLALAATSAPNNSYLQYGYVGSGVTTRTWTVTMPSTPGAYEFRLFPDAGYVRAATSPTITVLSGPNPVPTVMLLAPSGAPVGVSAITMVVNGTGFVSSSIVRWNGLDRPTTVVSGTELHATIPATDLAAAGTTEISVFSPAPGGGVSPDVPFTIGQSPSLTVSSTSVTAGGSITAMLTNGFGGTTDWLALAPTSAPETSYLQWTYVGAGVTSTTWTVTMPSTPGTYEFRLFMNGWFTPAATSPSITVIP